ncbi:MAG: SDR family oxidoreductase [Bryobacteraceae bacterium]|nr:SDR family oxidoreductase [Bryobacteraceae bacterium]
MEETLNSEFKGKTALITGASRGIGGATAIALARNGASRVVLHYNSYEEGAKQAAGAVRTLGAEVRLFQADLASDDGIRKLAETIRAEQPGIDILINNAGSLVKRAALAEFTPELFDAVMNLNVKSAYFAAQAAAPYMISKGAGVIVNLSSIAARHGGGPVDTIYSAAKAAVSTITKGMAKELAPNGIRVNAVSPGTVDNYFHEQFSTKAMLESMAAATPAARLGTNEEMADVIVFLCSRASRYMYGQTIEVNGGMYMV